MRQRNIAQTHLVGCTMNVWFYWWPNRCVDLMKEIVASKIIRFTITFMFGLPNRSDSQKVLLLKLSMSMTGMSPS